MKRIVVVGSLTFAVLLLNDGRTWAHGGSYRGPGDTVPAGGGGGGGGTAGPSVPTPGGPGNGGPSTPFGPAGTGPGGASTGGFGGGGTASTGERANGELTSWEFWWAFNKEPYLNLKAAVHSNSVSTGSDEAFLGNGTRARAKNTLRPSEESIRTRIVPALRRALEKERANDIVTGALVALAKIGDAEGGGETVALLSRFLGDPQQEIAETAAISLGISASDEAVGTLLHLVRDDPSARQALKTNEVPYRTRAFAAFGLGLVGARTNSDPIRQQIVGALLEIVRGPETSTRDIKVACMTALGLTPIDLRDQGEAATGAAASREAQIAAIEACFADAAQHHLVRAHAPTALARLLTKDEARIPTALRLRVEQRLFTALDEHSKERDTVQQSCILALGQLVDCDADAIDLAVRNCLSELADRAADTQTRAFCCIALAQIGGRARTANADERGLRDIRNFLGEHLTKGSSAIRPWAGISIGVMEHALATASPGAFMPSSTQKSALRAALAESRSPETLGAYAIASAIAYDGESKPILLEKLGSAPGEVSRGYVSVALGLLAARDALEPIQAIVRDAKYKPELLRQSAIALGLLGDKDLVPELCKMLQEAKGLSAQAALASALGFIGDARSIEPLIAMLENKERLTDSARGFAAVALGIVADKEELPWNSKVSIDLNYRANTTTLTGENGTGILDIL